MAWWSPSSWYEGLQKGADTAADVVGSFFPNPGNVGEALSNPFSPGDAEVFGGKSANQLRADERYAAKQGAIVPTNAPTGTGGPMDPFIQQQIASLASGDIDASIREGVQMDVLGPGYQQSEFGAAAAGVPGAGRVLRGREAVERKAAIQGARMRQQNQQLQHQLINAYLGQAFQLKKLSSQEATTLAELLSGTSMWASQENPDLARAMPDIIKKMAEADDALEMQHIFTVEAAKYA